MYSIQRIVSGSMNMLYISRQISLGDTSWENEFGVVDTDDDVEEIVTWGSLSYTFRDVDIEVEGVTYTKKRRSTDDGEYKMVFDITPYQDVRYYSARQAKLKTLYGVDLRTWNGEITYLGVDFNKVPKGLSIRLSDFGQRIGYLKIELTSVPNNPQPLTLVLDDKIKFNHLIAIEMTFDVILDFTEVTDDNLVNRCYDFLEPISVAGIDLMGKCLVDRKGRYKTGA